MLRESFTLASISGRVLLLQLANDARFACDCAGHRGADGEVWRSLRNLARESFEGSKQLTDTAQEALANQGIVKRTAPRSASQNVLLK
jgi:hypothetical protein